MYNNTYIFVSVYSESEFQIKNHFPCVFFPVAKFCDSIGTNIWFRFTFWALLLFFFSCSFRTIVTTPFSFPIPFENTSNNLQNWRFLFVVIKLLHLTEWRREGFPIKLLNDLMKLNLRLKCNTYYSKQVYAILLKRLHIYK